MPTSDDANSLLTTSVLASDQTVALEGVQVWNPEATLKSLAIKGSAHERLTPTIPQILAYIVVENLIVSRVASPIRSH